MRKRWIVIGIIGLLGLTMVACGPSTGPGSTAGTESLQVVAQNLRFDPAALTVKAGQQVTLNVVNKDSIRHTWEVEGVQGVGVGLLPGGEGTVEFTIDEPGTYTVFCGVPGHREQGMVGELIVQQ